MLAHGAVSKRICKRPAKLDLTPSGSGKQGEHVSDVFGAVGGDPNMYGAAVYDVGGKHEYIGSVFSISLVLQYLGRHMGYRLNHT